MLMVVRPMTLSGVPLAADNLVSPGSPYLTKYSLATSAAITLRVAPVSGMHG